MRSAPAQAARRLDVPVHLVPDVPGHGVVRYAEQVAAAVGAPVRHELSDADLGGSAGVHLHVTDRLFGSTPEEAAETVLRVCALAPTTVTLHDVPQPSDGPGFARRAAAYRSILQAARGWVTNSHHECRLVTRHTLPGGPGGAVIHLPVMGPHDAPAPGRSGPGRPAVVGVLGWVYPGKGHVEVIEAVRALPAATGPVEVLAVGAASPGHAGLLDQLSRQARDAGVGFSTTGYLDDRAVLAVLRDVDVAVAAHRNVSASGSVNSWLEAGRRPLVRESGYTREVAALRPGTVRLFCDDGLTAALEAALARPVSTVLASDATLSPRLSDVALAYRRWWSGLR